MSTKYFAIMIKKMGKDQKNSHLTFLKNQIIMFRMKSSLFLLMSLSLMMFSCFSKLKMGKPDDKVKDLDVPSEVIEDHDEDGVAAIILEEDGTPVDAPVDTEVDQIVSMSQMAEGQIIYVPSDLAQEFPEQAHKNIAAQMGIDVEEILYYNNRSEVLAIYVKTDYPMSDPELENLQSQLYQILWDFTNAKVTTIIKKDNEIYKIIASRKDRDSMALMIYDFPHLKTEFGKVIKEISAADDYPLKEKEIFGVYFIPGSLSRDSLENLTETTLYFVVAEEDEYIEYHTMKNEIHLMGQKPLFRESQKLFYDENHENAIKVCPDGSLLYRDNQSSFLRKYTGFRMKVDE